MQKAIKIYTLSTCVHCKATKKLLNECGMTYECIDVDLLTGESQKAVIEDVRNTIQSAAFPQLLLVIKSSLDFEKMKSDLR